MSRSHDRRDATRTRTAASVPTRPPKRADADRPVVPRPPAPPFLRDPWLLVSALAVLPALLFARGAALGEPVAEDFDFLRHVLLEGRWSWLDGGGSLSFWRPLSQQTYYGIFGRLMLDHPRAIATVHVGFLVATTVLLYRLLRTWWSGSLAASAAVFPLLAESTRSLITWPGHFADVGCLFCSVLALHEAVRRRLPTSLLALTAALLCKEQAIVTAVLLPWLPGAGSAPAAQKSAVARDDRGRAHPTASSGFVHGPRRAWVLASGAVLIAWILTYTTVRRAAGLALPHGVESDLATHAVPIARRLLWAFTESGRALFSLPVAMTPREVIASTVLLVLAVLSALPLLLRKPAARRAQPDRALALWGLAWFVLSSAALASIFPLWSPARSIFGAVGLGVLLAAAWSSLRPMFFAGLLAVKLGALALAPAAPAMITDAPPANGDFMDFARITRLQRLMAETRSTLQRALPHVPRHAVFGESGMPREAVYAFGESRAVQAWYRDTTLRWVSTRTAMTDTTANVVAIVQFQRGHRPPIALVDPRAMRAMGEARDDIGRRDWAGALARLAAADSLQPDANARVFRSDVAAHRTYALGGLGEFGPAIAEAARGLRLAPENRALRMAYASMLHFHGDTAAAAAEFDRLQREEPGDSAVARLRRDLRQSGARAR